MAITILWLEENSYAFNSETLILVEVLMLLLVIFCRRCPLSKVTFSLDDVLAPPCTVVSSLLLVVFPQQGHPILVTVHLAIGLRECSFCLFNEVSKSFNVTGTQLLLHNLGLQFLTPLIIQLIALVTPKVRLLGSCVEVLASVHGASFTGCETCVCDEFFVIPPLSFKQGSLKSLGESH